MRRSFSQHETLKSRGKNFKIKLVYMMRGTFFM